MFERHVTVAEAASDPHTALAALGRAAAVWRGDVLEDLPHSHKGNLCRSRHVVRRGAAHRRRAGGAGGGVGTGRSHVAAHRRLHAVLRSARTSRRLAAHARDRARRGPPRRKLARPADRVAQPRSDRPVPRRRARYRPPRRWSERPRARPPP
ncbi:BTAD domain-containing putative transcriptional regulator [Amycolatopsis acidiphila]|uniref:BTAD domain-containing putative transcriptional regulator n=1 Tax=Amycolatopsis acidiphila TaxID=715473 RepID=UPI0038994ED5